MAFPLLRMKAGASGAEVGGAEGAAPWTGTDRSPAEQSLFLVFELQEL